MTINSNNLKASDLTRYLMKFHDIYHKITKYWCKTNAAFQTKNIIPTVKQFDSVMVWGRFAALDLQVMDPIILYQEMLKENVLRPLWPQAQMHLGYEANILSLPGNPPLMVRKPQMWQT